MNKKDDVMNLEGFLVQLRDVPRVDWVVSLESIEALHSVHIIGFHHKQGSIIEYSYPNAVECNLLPYLALPDCVHNETEETFFFTVNILGELKHCVSCFRQVPNDNITEQMNRNFVQKALVIIANLPFYAIIASKMHQTTQLYFEQRNFCNTSIISDAFESLKSSLKDCKISDLYTGFSTRMLLHVFKEKILMIWKLILLQGRIIVFSKKPSHVTSAIYGLLSLFPGQLCFDHFQYCESYLQHLKIMGLPLQLLNNDFAFHSYFSIFQLDELEKTGYLIGCTNQMILEHPRSKPNAILNLDTSKIKFSFNKSTTNLKLNSFETKFIKDLIKVRSIQTVESSWEKSETWTNSDNIVWQGSHSFIIAEFHKLLKSQLANLALLRLKLQGVKIETTVKIPKESSVKKFEYSEMTPKLKKIGKYKKFTKGLKGSFLFKWANCTSFIKWIERHSPSFANHSELCGVSLNCEVLYENGDSYYGNLYKGLRHGLGSLRNEEMLYEGDWRDDKKTGKGVQRSRNGDIYDGEWVNGVMQGMGHWSYKSGDVYRGEFAENLFSGQGQMTFASGDLYNGNFELGKICGIGEYLYLNGDVHKGRFQDNKPNGRGELVKKNGLKIEGYFQDGELSRNEVSITYEDGRVFQGSVDEKFRPHGLGVMKFPSSNISPGMWTHGIQEY